MSDAPKVGGALLPQEDAPVVMQEELNIAPEPKAEAPKPKAKKAGAKFDKHGNKILGKSIAK